MVVAIAGGVYCWADARIFRSSLPYRDFDDTWLAARLMLAHRNPYALIGPGRGFWGFSPYFHPLTAGVAVLPIAWLGLLAARITFTGLSAGLFAFVITKRSWALIPSLLSFSMLQNLGNGQWSMLMIAAAFLPWIGGLLSAKPNIAAVMLLAQPARRQWIGTAIGSLVLLAVAFAFMPTWPLSWRANIGIYHDPLLITVLPLGPLCALALVRWRRPEARLFVLQTVVRRTVCAYAELPLFLVARDFRQAFVLCVGSYVGTVIQAQAIAADGTYNVLMTDTGYLLCMYLPALVMILRRPNVDEGLLA